MDENEKSSRVDMDGLSDPKRQYLEILQAAEYKNDQQGEMVERLEMITALCGIQKQLNFLADATENAREETDEGILGFKETNKKWKKEYKAFAHNINTHLENVINRVRIPLRDDSIFKNAAYLIAQGYDPYSKAKNAGIVKTADELSRQITDLINLINQILELEQPGGLSEIFKIFDLERPVPQAPPKLRIFHRHIWRRIKSSGWRLMGAGAETIERITQVGTIQDRNFEQWKEHNQKHRPKKIATIKATNQLYEEINTGKRSNIFQTKNDLARAVVSRITLQKDHPKNISVLRWIEKGYIQQSPTGIPFKWEYIDTQNSHQASKWKSVRLTIRNTR